MVYNRVAAKFGPCGAQLGECGLVELGATWLHGVAGHPVYEAALRLGFMDGTERERASAPPCPPAACEQAGRVRSMAMLLPGQAVRALCSTCGSAGCLPRCASDSLLGTQRAASARLPVTLGQ